MSWRATLTEMLTEIKARGGWRRSTSLTDDVLTSFLNAGIAEVHDLIAKHNPDFLVTSKDRQTISGVATISLPPDFYKLRRLDLLDGTTPIRLRSYQIDDETYLDSSTSWDSSAGATRYRYMLQAGVVRFVPTPTETKTIRIWYIPAASKLEIGADQYDGVNGHEDLVYEHALRMAKSRDRVDTSSHDAAIARLEKRLTSALEARDQAEPEYLPDLGRWEGE